MVRHDHGVYQRDEQRKDRQEGDHGEHRDGTGSEAAVHVHKENEASLERRDRQDRSVGEVPERASEPLPDIDPACLQQALNELPEVFRTPIILYYFEDFSYRDIADQMDLPLGTVMSRLARAKAYLRGRLLQPAGAALANEGETDGL